jgi:hypothetical protein
MSWRVATVAVLLSGLLFTACGSSGSSVATPSAATPMPPLTPTSGRLQDVQAAQDIVAWNMVASGGASYRRQDVICRWELPVPVYLTGDLDRAAVLDALDYWASAAGITHVVVGIDELPRLLIRPGTDGLAAQGGGRGLVDGTFANNRARSGLVVIEPGGGQFCRASAQTCRYLYRHEIGHSLGFLAHSEDGLMSSGTDVLSDRERRMMVALYSLPHGARVQSDGSWQVIAP